MLALMAAAFLQSCEPAHAALPARAQYGCIEFRDAGTGALITTASVTVRLSSPVKHGTLTACPLFASGFEEDEAPQ